MVDWEGWFGIDDLKRLVRHAVHTFGVGVCELLAATGVGLMEVNPVTKYLRLFLLLAACIAIGTPVFSNTVGLVVHHYRRVVKLLTENNANLLGISL